MSRRALPGVHEALEAACHVADGGFVRDLALEPAASSVVEDGATDREAFDLRLARGGREGHFQLILRRLKPEQHDAAAIGIVAGNYLADGAPGRLVLLRLELPPIRLDAKPVEMLENARHRVGCQHSMLAGDDLHHKLAADAPRGVV